MVQRGDIIDGSGSALAKKRYEDLELRHDDIKYVLLNYSRSIGPKVCKMLQAEARKVDAALERSERRYKWVVVL